MKWISFNDGSPQEPEEYLVTDGKAVSTMEFHGNHWMIETGMTAPFDLMPINVATHTNLTHWMPLPSPGPQPLGVQDLLELEADRLTWSLETFPEATPISSLRKLESEVREIESDIISGIKNAEEYADALMCLFDSAGRLGITVPEIIDAFAAKLVKNMNRKWAKNPDNSYSHIK